MSISVNGQSQVPPGFRFHPTEEELLHYYLRKKVSNEKIDLDVICDVDLNKLEPWDIQESCKIGTTPRNDWYLFSHKDKKYPNGMRTNRATAAGFWKATGRDKVVYGNGKRIGMRKTLVFYMGRAPHGCKSDWIMHEYRLDQDTIYNLHMSSDVVGEATEGGWVVCRVFKKKNHFKSPTMMTSSLSADIALLNSRNQDSVEEVIMTCKEENDNNTLTTTASSEETFSSQNSIHHLILDDDSYDQIDGSGLISDWSALDRLVACELNGQLDSFSNSVNNKSYNLYELWF